MEGQGKFVSMQMKLIMMVGLFLLLMAFCLGGFFQYRLSANTDALGQKHVEEITAVLTLAVRSAPDTQAIQSVLDAFSDVPGAMHATLRSTNGELIGAWPRSGIHLEQRTKRLSGTVLKDGEVWVTRSVKLHDDRKTALTICIDLSLENLALKRSNFWGVFILSVFLVVVGVMASSVIARRLVRPLRELVLQTGELVETGDLTSTIAVESNDETGQLAINFRTVVEGQRGALIAIRRSTDSVGQVIAKLSEAGMSVSSGAVTIQSLVRDTASSIEALLSSLRGVSINVESLQESSVRGATFIVQMANANDEIASNMETMTTAVHQSTQAIDRMATSVQETARNIGDLEGYIAGTSGSMTEMAKAISQVEGNAQDTVLLSTQASAAATVGGEALRATLNGIDKISNASQTAFDVITNLNGTTIEIGNIVGVIKGVADQTNLLALNASIIASQAGEHGKGFGVVADEIKNLAERTRISTTEIAALIDKIQQESLHAIEAMEHGIENVAQGLKLGRQADEAFVRILESTESSSDMIQEIATDAQKQSRQTKQITSLVQRVSLNAKQITRASDDQASGSREIRDGTRRMNALSEQAHQSSMEQAQGSRQVIQAIEEINDMVSQVNNAQQMQTRSSEDVLQAVQLIHEVCTDQDASVRELDQAIMSLQGQAEELRVEIQRFKV
jgi:methyl-accepting chemotaxis protein